MNREKPMLTERDVMQARDTMNAAIQTVAITRSVLIDQAGMPADTTVDKLRDYLESLVNELVMRRSQKDATYTEQLVALLNKHRINYGGPDNILSGWALRELDEKLTELAMFKKLFAAVNLDAIVDRIERAASPDEE